MRILALAVASVAAVTATPTLACSVTDDYRVPTNLELAADAEIIFLGKVLSGPAEMEKLSKAELVVEPIASLKGDVSSQPLKLPGMIAPSRFAVKSNPADLNQAHPLAYIGGCIRYMFVKGSTVLFFVSHAEKAFGGEVPAELKGILMPAGGAFARWAEDVPSADSAWVVATKIYVKAAALPKDQQKQFLETQRDALLRAPAPYSRLIAADIDRQLAGPNKPWNQLMHEEIEKMEKRKEEKPSIDRG
jgi:hypothetical protein